MVLKIHFLLKTVNVSKFMAQTLFDITCGIKVILNCFLFQSRAQNAQKVIKYDTTSPWNPDYRGIFTVGMYTPYYDPGITPRVAFKGSSCHVTRVGWVLKSQKHYKLLYEGERNMRFVRQDQLMSPEGKARGGHELVIFLGKNK